MNITFIYLDIRTDFPLYSGQYHEGIACLSATLKREGHKVSLIHTTKPMSEEQLCNWVADKKPDLIGFSTMTNFFHYLTQWAGWLKKCFPQIPVICGGVHPTIAPDETINVEGIDMICIGEGEEALAELCDYMSRGKDIVNIRNIWVKKNGKVYRNSPRPLLVDLDKLPDPDRDVFDFDNLMSSKESIGLFTASRGCPHNCTYCCNHVLRAVYPNPYEYVRFRSVDRVIEDIGNTLTKHSYLKYIAFNDDILGMKMEWLREFVQAYERVIGLPFICNSRIELIKEEFVELLKKAGCTTIYIGLESGNEDIRAQLLGRKMTNERIIEAFALLKRAGIKTRTYNMVGLPFEDMGKTLETIKLNARLNPVGAMVSIFYPYPGSLLHKVCIENGFITQKQFDSYEEGTVLSQPKISEQEVLFAYYYFKVFLRAYSFVYKLPTILTRHGESLLDRVFCSSSLPHSLLTKLYLVVYRGLRYIYLKVIVRFHNRTRYLFTADFVGKRGQDRCNGN